LRKALAILAAAGAGALVAWLAGSRAFSGETVVLDWPDRKFARQFPNRAENESATRLMSTVERFGDELPKARASLTDYIRKEGPPPPFLEKHANTIRTLRAQIASNPPPVWALQIDDILEPPLPPLTLHMQLFQLLGADALAQHKSGNEAAAWADLRAAWILSQALWNRPEAWSVGTAMVGNRVIAAVAAKLDPPLPAWWSDAAAFDVRPPLVRSIAYEAWAARARADRFPVGESDGSRLDNAVRRAAAPFVRPIRVAQASLVAGRLRHAAAAVENSDPCEPFVIASMPEWAGFVRRFNRFRIEREGVDKLLTLKSGGAFSPASQCRSGRWTWDGTTLAFHGALPPPTSRATIIPLAHRLPAS
jgi:hypothetical protein